MAKSNRGGGYLLLGDRVCLLIDQHDGKSTLAKSGDKGTVIKSETEELLSSKIRVKLDKGGEVLVRRKVVIRIGN